jgi:hypothetical protein
MKKSTLIILVIFLSLEVVGQSKVIVKNPSFEGKLVAGVLDSETDLDYWIDCGQYIFPKESGFDIQPGSFEVVKEPKHGDSYVGLITRINGTYESIGQKLKERLRKDSVYTIKIYLAKSDQYWSLDKSGVTTKQNFSASVVLRLWGGNAECQKDELLYTSDPIFHSEWIEYSIQFKPAENYKYLLFEAFHPSDDKFVRGNLLLDAINSKDVSRLDSAEMANLLAYQIIDRISSDTCNLEDIYPKIALIKTLQSLKENESTIDIFLESLTETEWKPFVEALNSVEAISVLEIIGRLQAILFSNEEISTKDEQFLLDWTALYAESIKEKTIGIYMTDFVRENRGAIIKGIISCE